MIILFDLDGTLIDSTEAILESFHNAFDVLNHPRPSDDKIKNLIGHPLDVMFSSFGVREEMVSKSVTIYKEHYQKIYIQKTVLLKSARAAVEKASKFATLGIVTTKTGKYSKILMEHFELMNYFDVLIGREDVENPKPHKEPIVKALSALKPENMDVWMIGDTRMDLLSAKNAGVNSIGVLCGYETYDSLKEYSNIICNDTYEAIEYLESRKISHI